MTFLVDNQLPPALAAFLRAKGFDAVHVADAKLDESTCRDLLRFAGDNDFIIVSKDEDFLHLSMREPSGPTFL